MLDPSYRDPLTKVRGFGVRVRSPRSPRRHSPKSFAPSRQRLVVCILCLCLCVLLLLLMAIAGVLLWRDAQACIQSVVVIVVHLFHIGRRLGFIPGVMIRACSLI